MELSKKELAKMSEDIFASNLENKFWATNDGCFFKTERQANDHAFKIQSLVTLFERDITEEVAETATEIEVVTKEEEVTEFKQPITENKTPKTGKK